MNSDFVCTSNFIDIFLTLFLWIFIFVGISTCFLFEHEARKIASEASKPPWASHSRGVSTRVRIEKHFQSCFCKAPKLTIIIACKKIIRWKALMRRLRESNNNFAQMRISLPICSSEICEICIRSLERSEWFPTPQGIIWWDNIGKMPNFIPHSWMTIDVCKDLVIINKC